MNQSAQQNREQDSGVAIKGAPLKSRNRASSSLSDSGYLKSLEGLLERTFIRKSFLLRKRDWCMRVEDVIYSYIFFFS